MLSFPNAKINLGLNVIERRPDGYHNLETVFYPLALSDILEVLTGKSFQFHSSGLMLDTEGGDNLVVKAYSLLKSEFDLPPVRIHLHKVIPFGAGLGGGSSDAAYMLKMLSRLFGLGLSSQELQQYAAKLGADCPFFIDNHPSLATGIGDELTPISLDLDKYYIALVKPPLGVNTAHAYKAIRPSKHQTSIKDIMLQPVETWKECLNNDFETPVFKSFPEITSVKRRLYELGALYASMSGSGSSVYGIFQESPGNLHEYFSADYFVFGQAPSPCRQK
jgi:4-diphosphocytidyl-2-C-methyl-D-erythritol kinase